MNQETATPAPLFDQSFPTDPSGLPEATRPEVLDLADGDTLSLNVASVAKTLRETWVPQLMPGESARIDVLSWANRCWPGDMSCH